MRGTNGVGSGVGGGVGAGDAEAVAAGEGAGVGAGDGGTAAGLQEARINNARIGQARCICLCRQPGTLLSSATGNFCGTRDCFMVFCQASHGLWLSLVERLNGVQEVPGSNPGSPIFRCLGNLLRTEEVREDCGVSEVLQFAGSSQCVLTRADGDFLLLLSVGRELRRGFGDSRGLIRA